MTVHFNSGLYDVLKILRFFLKLFFLLIVGLVLATIIMIQIPPVQNAIGTMVAETLSDKLGTQCEVGRVNLGIFNRIIIDDLLIYDKQSKHMIKTSRMAAKISVLDLLKGKVSVSSAQLFGMQAVLYKNDSLSAPNYQFLLDALAETDTTSQTTLNLSIGSLIVRHGKIHYDNIWEPNTPNAMNMNHLHITDISTHVLLPKLTDKELSLTVKKLSFKEASGLNVNDLSFKLVANQEKATLEGFHLCLPNTVLNIPSVEATFQFVNDEFKKESLEYKGIVSQSSVTLSDFSCFNKSFKSFDNPISVLLAFSGTTHNIDFSDLQMKSTNDIIIKAKGKIGDLQGKPRWLSSIQQLELSEEAISAITSGLQLNQDDISPLKNSGRVGFKGELGGTDNHFFVNGSLLTDAGNTELNLDYADKRLQGHIKTDGLQLGRILNNEKLGFLVMNADIDGSLQTDGTPSIRVLKGTIEEFEYNQYTFRNLTVDGSFMNNIADASIIIDDPNGRISLDGVVKTGNVVSADIKASFKSFNPTNMRLFTWENGATFDGNLEASVTGSSIDNLNGLVRISKFAMIPTNPEAKQYTLDDLRVLMGHDNDTKYISMQSDFGNIDIVGRYNFENIAQSLSNIICSRFPSMPFFTSHGVLTPHNDFRFAITLTNSDWLNVFSSVPLELKEPLQLSGAINDYTGQITLEGSAPRIYYDEGIYDNTHINVNTESDGSIVVDSHLSKISGDGNPLTLDLTAHAGNNQMHTSIAFNTNKDMPVKGILNSTTEFYKDINGKPSVHVHVQPSEILVNDTVWNVEPSEIIYQDKDLAFDYFAIKNNEQHIIVNGRANDNLSDSLIVDLQNVDVGYILDLVDFDAVDFSGKATGKACIKSAFSKPDGYAKLQVNEFRFEDGRMGTLLADVEYNQANEQIDIDAQALDHGCTTLIKGYVSPAKDYIDLRIQADSTRLEFLKSFCGSFMDNINAYGTGLLRLYGDLDYINLTGEVFTIGDFDLTTLGTHYTMTGDTIKLVPNNIIFNNTRFTDRFGKQGKLSGALHHQYLTRLTYDLHIDADHLLCYDFDSYGDNTFYGTIFASGSCDIKGSGGRIDFDINATAHTGSFVEYDAASPDAITNQEFITWRDRSSLKEAENSLEQTDNNGSIQPAAPSSADMHINFLVNATPDFTLRVLMDKSTNDHIALNGTGTIRATWHNYGSFDMFGNFLVDHGYYKFTIQNLLQREFQFEQGGSIIFGGNAYSAKLNLPARYTLNGVSLSDLQIGESFSSNNVRVDCLMDITGTPANPLVDFDIEMPSVGTDANQMIRSLINSEQEMNQQVIYLLSIGRFYNPRPNNADMNTPQSQASLAMQSLLSGTISQQINNALKSVMNTRNWNLGANIATGQDGFNNAEYEGLLSGSLLNNRLLINGQFGYRDNANATTSFIGDFDIRYLLQPNGNLAIKVYNQANDRYFTRNTLNTQGIGLIMKKDFDFRDLFTRRKKRK